MADQDEMYGELGNADEALDKTGQTGDEAEEQNETLDEKTEEEGAGESALLPKSILAGKDFTPGDELVLKVVAMHGDEVEVEYASTKSPKNKPKGGSMDDGMARGKTYNGIGDRMMSGMGEG